MSTITNVHIDDLHMHPEMDDLRGVNEAWVATLDRKFNPDAFTLLLVSPRAEGGYWLIDGAHRSELARKRGWTHVMCEVVGDAMTAKQIAATYLDANTSRQQHPLTRWHMSVMAEDPSALEITRICDEYGFVVPRNPQGRDGLLTCVGELRRAHKQAVLEDCLLVLRDAFNRDWAVSQTWFMRGLIQVLSTRREEIDVDRLIRKLSEKGAMWLRHRYMGAKDASTGGYVAIVMANVILAAYNSGLRSGAVEYIRQGERAV